MPRYIDADALHKKIYPLDLVDKRNYSINAKAVEKAIFEMPTADVAPKSEIAREIFAEIDVLLCRLMNDKNYSIGEFAYDFCDLNEKYTKNK